MVLGENVSGIGVVVGDIMAVGFRMAGVPHVHTDPAMVRSLLDRKDLGVLVLTSKIFEALDVDTKSRVLSSIKPAVVVLDADEGRMKEYVKKLTGVDVG